MPHVRPGPGRSPLFPPRILPEEEPRRSHGWRLRTAQEMQNATRLSRSLGWLSLALGGAALAAPRGVAGLIGLNGHHALVRFVGLRELATGVGIFTERRDRSPWIWSRFAGDLMDLALLGIAMRPGNPGRGRAMAAFAAVAGVTALDFACARQLSGARVPLIGAGRYADVYVEHSLSINRSPEECYRFWRDLENLPRFMRHLQSVQVQDDTRSHWVAKGPAGALVEWDAEITEDRPGERLAWRSLEGADVPNAGAVTFEAAPGGRGTIVRVVLHYRPPAGGRFGALVARSLREEPRFQVREDLRRFKQVMETGEVATTEGQPSGRRSLIARVMRRGRLS